MWWASLLAAGVVLLLVQWRQSGQKLIDFLGLGLVYVYARLWHGCTANVASPLPAKGPAILVSNHTCSADPAFLQWVSNRPLSFLIAREYYVNLKWARKLFEYIGCVPVARNNRDVAAVRLALRRLNEGRIICIFPEGGLSGAGRQRLRPGKHGAALLALRSGAPVIPAFISGGPQTSAILPAWLFPSRVRITFGSPIDLSAWQGRRLDRALLDKVTTLIMKRIEELRPRVEKPADNSRRRLRASPRG